MAKMSKKELQNKNFVALNTILKEVLKDDVEYSGKVIDNQAVTQFIMTKYGKACSENIIKELESRGLLDSSSGEAEAPTQPQIKTTPASAAHAAAKAAAPQAPAQPPKFAQPPEEPQEQPSGNIDPSELLDFMANNHGGLYRDGQWLRTGTGLYVCPFCLDSVSDPADIVVADATKKIGPHAKSHQVKNRSVADSLLETLPEYSAVQQPAHGGVDDSKPVEVPLSDAPSHESHTEIVDPAGNDSEKVDATPGPLHMDNSEVLSAISALSAKLERMETTLATALVVVLSLPEEQRQQLYTRFAADKVGTLSEILTRKI